MSTPYSRPRDEVHYPYDDGAPLAESDHQLRPLVYALDALKGHFADRPHVYVAGDMFVYYEEGNPKSVVAPDVFVVIGADKRDRYSYMLWKEPKAPDFVLEVTSASTRAQDQGPKKGTYAFMGVREYWQYDPTGDYLPLRLQGAYLEDGNYLPLPVERQVPEGVLGHSQVLGLDLRVRGGEFRFVDPGTGEPLPSYDEVRETATAAVQRAEREATARRAAEERLARLEAELKRLKGDEPG
jgi:Uma2 family endonuclease